MFHLWNNSFVPLARFRISESIPKSKILSTYVYYGVRSLVVYSTQFVVRVFQEKQSVFFFFLSGPPANNLPVLTSASLPLALVVSLPTLALLPFGVSHLPLLILVDFSISVQAHNYCTSYNCNLMLAYLSCSQEKLHLYYIHVIFVIK